MQSRERLVIVSDSSLLGRGRLFFVRLLPHDSGEEGLLRRHKPCHVPLLERERDVRNPHSRNVESGSPKLTVLEPVDYISLLRRGKDLREEMTTLTDHERRKLIRHKVDGTRGPYSCCEDTCLYGATSPVCSVWLCGVGCVVRDQGGPYHTVVLPRHGE